MRHDVYTFIQRKIALLDRESPQSRALCAKLRRGIGKHPGELPEVWEVTLSDAPGDWASHHSDSPSHAEYAVHTALTLYAFHRQGKAHGMSAGGKDESGHYTGNSFGAAAARLVRPDESNLAAVKRRFDAAATALNLTELAHHARGIVGLLKAGDITMDYPRFAQDLFYYQKPDHKNGVRLRWGEDFYRVKNNKRKDEDDQ